MGYANLRAAPSTTGRRSSTRVVDSHRPSYDAGSPRAAQSARKLVSPEEFRRYGHELIDWLADYHESLADRPVMAKTRPGEIRDALPATPPNEPEKFGAMIEDLNRLVVPGLSLWQHPRFFGYFPANALPAGILADIVSTGLGVIGLSWQSSPAV